MPSPLPASATFYFGLMLVLYVAHTIYARMHTESAKDPAGHAVFRYPAASVWGFLACAMAFFIAARYEWAQPENHRYPGNLMFVFYPLIALGCGCVVMFAYQARYVATLYSDRIEIRRPPLPALEYKLNELLEIDDDDVRSVLLFSGDRRLTIPQYMQGSEDFVDSADKLSANNRWRGP